MMIDVDDEKPLEACNAGARQIAAFHDDDGRVVAGLDVDAIGDLNVRHARKLHQRRRRGVGVDDRHLFAEGAERIGGGQLGSDRVAVGTRVRGDDEPLLRPDGLDNLLKLRTRHYFSFFVPPSAGPRIRASLGVLVLSVLISASSCSMRSWPAIDSSYMNVSSGTRFRRSRRADLAAQEGHRPLEGAAAVRAGLVVAERRVEDARLLKIGRHLHARDGHEPDARIVHLARQEQRELGANLVGDAVGTGSLGHARGASVQEVQGQDSKVTVRPGSERILNLLRELRGYAVTATRSIENTSMTSPTLRSLNLSKPMPHSNPAFTSLASSLNRRSDPILPS